VEKKDTAKAAEPKADESKNDDKPQPVVDAAQNPEGVDLTKGAKDAAPAYEED